MGTGKPKELGARSLPPTLRLRLIKSASPTRLEPKQKKKRKLPGFKIRVRWNDFIGKRWNLSSRHDYGERAPPRSPDPGAEEQGTDESQLAWADDAAKAGIPTPRSVPKQRQIHFRLVGGSAGGLGLDQKVRGVPRQQTAPDLGRPNSLPGGICKDDRLFALQIGSGQDSTKPLQSSVVSPLVGFVFELSRIAARAFPAIGALACTAASHSAFDVSRLGELLMWGSRFQEGPLLKITSSGFASHSKPKETVFWNASRFLGSL